MGMIQYYAFDFAPKGWAICNGALLAVNQNQALFSLLGTQYGGDGSSTFALPDYRGRTIASAGGTAMGQIAGIESVTLQVGNMPAHTHTVQPISIGANNVAGTAPSPRGAYPANNSNHANMYGNTAATGKNTPVPDVVVGVTGGPLSVLNPYLAITCCIALQGIYPSRT